MAKRDFYEVLGISRKANEKELKSAFRKLAMKYHPDRNPDDKEAERQFKEVNEAYEALKDPQKRAAYDQFGHQAFESMGAGAGAHDFSSSMSDVFEDLFGDAMGGRRRSQGRGSDLRYNMEISLEESYKGKTAQISIPTSISCDICGGSGAKAGSSPKNCTSCNGSGKVRASQGFFMIERTCPNCQGNGQMIENPCTSCNGTGRVNHKRTLSVNIPAGVEDGTRIRLAGEGEAGLRGAPSGDLYIFISIRPHTFFQRDGSDLFCRVPISMTDATLGGQIEVPTIEGGRTRVKIPEGTQSGKQFRLRGKGMPRLRTNQYGDMYIQTVVETPCSLNKKQKDLLKQFEAESSAKNHPESSGFFKKVKDLWEGISN